MGDDYGRVIGNIRHQWFRVLCEISGKVCTYSYALGRLGAKAEFWCAQRRDGKR